jgi:large subunit ribosomal protein L19
VRLVDIRSDNVIQPLLQIVENKAKKAKNEIAAFAIGDTVTVHVRIVEGGKERVQPYTGVVIARRGGGINETFTVRRIVNNEGVERIFPLHSPKVGKIEVVRSGHVRRAKLYYLRDRVGKSRRLRDRKQTKAGGEASAAAAPAGAEA